MPGAIERTLVGKKLDVASIIGIIEPEKYPASSMIRKGKAATQVLLEQLVQEFPNAPFYGVPDGKPAGQNPQSTPREKLYSITMKLRREWQVSDLAAEVSLDGVPEGEMRHQKAICASLLKRMIEMSFFANRDVRNEDDGVRGTHFRGIPSWLQATEHSTYPVPANYRPTTGQRYTGTLANLTELAFRTMVDEASKQVNEPVTIDFFAGLDLRRTFDMFTDKKTLASGDAGLRAFNFDGKSKELSYGIDVFKWGSGMVRLHTSYWLLRDPDTGASSAGSYRSGYGVNLNRWNTRTMRAPRSVMLNFDGGAHKGYDDVVFSLIPENTKGSLVVEASG